jgi:hypothetical protein
VDQRLRFLVSRSLMMALVLPLVLTYSACGRGPEGTPAATPTPRHSGGEVGDLAPEFNGIENPDTIYPGQYVFFPRREA